MSEENPLKYFINRKDAWGQYDESCKGFTAKGEITEELLDKHIKGEITIGLHSTNNITNTCKWGAMDFDDEMANENQEVKKQQFNHADVCYDILLTDYNIRGWIEDSGRKGYHVVFKCRETDASYLYNLLNEVRAKAEDKVGHTIGGENYPKQPWISIEGYGNWIKMPLGIHPKTKKRMLVVASKTGLPLELDESTKIIETAPINEVPQIGEKVIGREYGEPVKRSEKKNEIKADCIKAMISNGAPQGNRHYSMMVLVHYFWQQGWQPDEIKKVLLEFNANCQPPKSIEDVEKELEFQWNRCEHGHAYFIGCKSEGIISQNLNHLCPYIDDKKNCYIYMQKVVAERQMETFEKKTDIKKMIVDYTDKLNLAQQMWDIQPYFYDRARLWWMWNRNKLCWEMIDEIDILNILDDALENRAGSTESTFKNEVLEAMKRYGRRKLPTNIKTTWIQIGKKIIDIKTDEEIVPTPEIFITNPIPWEIGETEETPTMDRLFNEWVGEDYSRTLYEITAYTILPDYPIHRIFCLNGIGCNGKGRFLALVERFIGKENTCTTSLTSITNNRFETSRLYKKLLCLVGETTDEILRRTDTLKRLCGQDSIGFEFKGKDGFTDKNYAKLIIATNTLPATTDKTAGFYRRWMVIDFPNNFPEGKDILDSIPETEYNNLAKKCCRILKELLDAGTFTNEGSIEDRARKYEKTSNFVANFVEDCCLDDPDSEILFSEFRRRLKKYLKSKGKRKLSSKNISKLLDLEGYGTDNLNKKINEEKWTKANFVIGLKWKTGEGLEQYA